MWPDHCIQGSDGAKYHPDLKLKDDDVEIVIGTNPKFDTISAFGNLNEKTGLK